MHEIELPDVIQAWQPALPDLDTSVHRKQFPVISVDKLLHWVHPDAVQAKQFVPQAVQVVPVR